MENTELPDIITVLTILKRFIASGIQVDAETRERIAAMTDEKEVFLFARDLIAETDKNAEDFINRLEENG